MRECSGASPAYYPHSGDSRVFPCAHEAITLASTTENTPSNDIVLRSLLQNNTSNLLKQFEQSVSRVS